VLASSVTYNLVGTHSLQGPHAEVSSRGPFSSCLKLAVVPIRVREPGVNYGFTPQSATRT
jgi:hypothetical protein